MNVQPHFGTLTASVKQDLSLSNTSASNSPPRSSSPPDTGSNNSQRMVRYLDRPIQPRSLSLSHPSTPDNNNPSAIGVPAAQTTPSTRAMGLKKNRKEIGETSSIWRSPLMGTSQQIQHLVYPLERKRKQYWLVMCWEIRELLRQMVMKTTLWWVQLRERMVVILLEGWLS